MKITSVATLVNANALADLHVLLFTLDLWNSPAPTLYIYTDETTDKEVKKISYSGKIHTKIALNRYSTLNRRQMERMPGTHYKTLFADFCAEKPSLMKWAMETSSQGVLFNDADICHLAELPEIPDNTQIALSRHMIRTYDEAKYGQFNAGFLYLQTPFLTERWLAACKTSRFFEQACLEDLADGSHYEFPIQNNYGWWRMFQSDHSSDLQKKAWSILRKNDSYSGILVETQPLRSIHTHWQEREDAVTRSFNLFVFEYLKKLTSMKKTKALLHKIESLLNP